jgi:hypothetical protein
MADQLQIFMLNWKEWFSVAEWPGLGLEGWICKSTNNGITEKYKNICNTLRPCPLQPHPVISTEFRRSALYNPTTYHNSKQILKSEILCSHSGHSRKTTVYCNAIPCSPGALQFRGTRCPHMQGQRHVH